MKIPPRVKCFIIILIGSPFLSVAIGIMAVACLFLPLAVLIWPEFLDASEVKPVRKSEGYVREVKS